MKNAVVAIALTASVAALALCSCSPTEPATGVVRVLMTDVPIDMTGVTGVVVTIDSMEIVAATADSSEGAGSHLVVSGDPPRGMTLNLLDFQAGNTAFVAGGDVPAGGYEKIRLHVVAAVLVRDTDGSPRTPDEVDPIFVPSGKVDVPVSFTVLGGETLEITLDFNAQLSVQVNSTPGQPAYILRPVITPVGARQL